MFTVAIDLKADAVINAGDMLPKDGDLYQQGKFISSFLKDHFSLFNSAGIYYLSYLGNDDLMIFDHVFEETCNQFSYIIPLTQRIFLLNGYEFIGMNWVVDYPFRLKDRCRMDTKDYVFQKQFGTGLLSTPGSWKELDDWFSYAHSLPTIEEELSKLPYPENLKNGIYIIHMPPAKLGLDKCYNGSEVGSRAICDFIAQRLFNIFKSAWLYYIFEYYLSTSILMHCHSGLFRKILFRIPFTSRGTKISISPQRSM